MTTKKRAKPEHLQKLTALFEQYPDGLNMKQILTELQTSVVNAEAALAEAVARCVVAMRLGDEVEVPSELCEQRKEGV